MISVHGITFVPRPAAAPAFFFQAEDGIRAATVTGVQTCALPISQLRLSCDQFPLQLSRGLDHGLPLFLDVRSEERRVGKECRSTWRWSESIKRRTDATGRQRKRNATPTPSSCTCSRLASLTT